MSNAALTWAFNAELDGLKPLDKFVLVAIADCANARGVAWPTYEYLTRVTGLSERRCQTAVNNLVELKLLERTHRRFSRYRQRSNLYRLKFDVGGGFRRAERSLERSEQVVDSHAISVGNPVDKIPPGAHGATFFKGAQCAPYDPPEDPQSVEGSSQELDAFPVDKERAQALASTGSAPSGAQEVRQGSQPQHALESIPETSPAGKALAYWKWLHGQSN